MLDSGAFSAWKMKKDVPLERYIEFIHANASALDTVVNLDVIPGTFGHKPSKATVEQSAEAGFQNLLRLKKEGIDAMPVFHQGEDFSWLAKMLDVGCTYIGLSPRKDNTTAKKKEWLNGVFAYLCGAGGYPAVRTHAFGETSASILFGYPWYSADSTSWMLVGGYGNILIPRRRSGGWDWDSPPITVNVSGLACPESGRVYRTELARSSYHYMSEAEQALIRSWITDECGQDFQYVQDSYLGRCQCNVYYFLATAKHLRVKPYRRRNLGLFQDFTSECAGSDKAQSIHTKQIFSMVQSEGYLQVLNDHKVRDRLVSYWIFHQNPNMKLDHFTRTRRKKTDE